MDAWYVYLDHKCVNIVYYITGMSAEEVKKSLVDHDAYPPDINVIKGKN